MKKNKSSYKKAIFLCQATDSHVKVVKSGLVKGGNHLLSGMEIEALAPNADDTVVVEILTRLFKKLEYKGEPIIVSLPRSSVTSRYIKLPATNPQEVELMASLQAARFLPYPAQELISGFQIIAMDKGYSEVTLIIAHKNAVARYAKIAQELKAISFSIVVSSVGLFSLYNQIEDNQTRPLALVDIDANQAEVAITEKDKLLFSRAFKIRRDAAGWEAGCNDEIARTIELYLKEVGRDKPERAIIFSAKEKQFHALAEALKRKIAVEELFYAQRIYSEEYLSTQSLYSGDSSCASLIGLSLASLPETMNLLPAEIKEARKLKSLKSSRLRLALSAVAIIVMCGLGSWRSLENKAQYLKKLKSQLNELLKEAKPLEDIEKRFQVLERYSKKQVSCVDVLYELHKSLPEDISLVSFIYEDNGSITIHGQAPELKSVFALVSRLEKSAAFKQHTIKVRYATKKRTAQGEVIDFEIIC